MNKAEASPEYSRPTEPITIAVVGAGPRGVSFLERLLARLEEITADGATGQASAQLSISSMRILVFDPYQPGAGRVWRTEQSPVLLMNTPSFFPTAAAASTPGLPNSSVGMTFDQWRQLHPELTAGLSHTDYPPRAMYGRYLSDLYQQVVEGLRRHSSITDIEWVASEVNSVQPQDGAYAVNTAAGTWHADKVVLNIGHGPARLNQYQRRIALGAEQAGLNYVAPHLPAELEYDRIPAGAQVLVRGMGLNFFDAMAELTVGRGGYFQQTGQEPGRTLEYVPSGEEPVLHAGTRRGVPYFPKPETDAFVPHGVRLLYFTQDAVDTLIAEHGQLDLAEHLWPLIHRDVLRAYYYTLTRTQPDLLGGPHLAHEFFSELVMMLEAAGRGEPITSRHAQELLHRYAPELKFFDIRRWGRPWGDRVFDSPEHYQSEVQTLLSQLCAQAVEGEQSALMMAFGTLHTARIELKTLIAQGHIAAPSRLRDVQGWFEQLVEGIASGPPLIRVEQLLALSRAGLVNFIGPDARFDVVYPDDTDAQPGEQQAYFVAVSPQVAADTDAMTAHLQSHSTQHTHRGSWMIEAMMPANRVELSESPLIRDLLSSGLATPHWDEDAEGTRVVGQGFHVTGRPHRLVDSQGQAHSTYVLGLQLASVQWGTAIAGEAGEDPDGRARTLGDADAVAQSILYRHSA